ncbi:hypothetical protein Poli38472_012287 [Pythium oligandrum]|uniref:Uncharacterized protein n=1 Tax=Pythium oligandrum TaxID=41045 RepID=A0A8K1FLI3_PYTOL|nr:hypothetical protein Poli38472_012287 [Pythium oligandrum]|eukprot:TMW67171.1 hypothetical protein Poli38472_012287 [Pythium oligandrum]
MRGLVEDISTQVIRFKNVEALEIILDSDLFNEVLSPKERKLALECMQRSLWWYRRDTNFLRVLIAHGVDVDKFTRQTPNRSFPYLFFGATAVPFFEELRRSGVVGLRSTTLGSEVWFEDIESARTLISWGVDVHGKPSEWTPLHSAVMTSSIEMVEAIITHSYVDVNAPGCNYPSRFNDGTTLLYARVAKDLRLQEMSVDKLDLLFSYGADPYIKSAKGISPYDMLMEHEIGRAYVSANEPGFPTDHKKKTKS